MERAYIRQKKPGYIIFSVDTEFDESNDVATFTKNDIRKKTKNGSLMYQGSNAKIQGNVLQTLYEEYDISDDDIETFRKWANSVLNKKSFFIVENQLGNTKRIPKNLTRNIKKYLGGKRKTIKHRRAS